MKHAGHKAYKKVDQRNRPCDQRGTVQLSGFTSGTVPRHTLLKSELPSIDDLERTLEK